MTERAPRLTKRDVEALLREYDSDPIGALTRALRVVLAAPDATWSELLALPGWPPQRRRALVALDQSALDELAAQLNEERRLPL